MLEGRAVSPVLEPGWVTPGVNALQTKVVEPCPQLDEPRFVHAGKEARLERYAVYSQFCCKVKKILHRHRFARRGLFVVDLAEKPMETVTVDPDLHALHAP